MRKAILVLFVFCLSSVLHAQEENDYQCSLILGDWTGIYRDDGTSWLRGSYQFDSSYDEDGSVIIDFDYIDSDESDRHEGYWLCENGILTTGLATRYGGSILYHYQIHDINQDTWNYQLISAGFGSPTFHANRVGARLKGPEIFDILDAL